MTIGSIRQPQGDYPYRVVTWDTRNDVMFATLEAAREYIAQNAPHSDEWWVEKVEWAPPPPEPEWVLIAPDGRRFTGSTPLRAVKAEMDSRLTPKQQAENLTRALAEELVPPPHPDSADAARYRWLVSCGADLRSLLDVGDFTTLEAHIDRAIRDQESAAALCSQETPRS